MTRLVHYLTMRSWPSTGMAVVLLVLCFGAFQWRHDAIGHAEVPDALIVASTAQLQRVYGAMGVAGRQLYALTQVTLDILFPLTYTFLFGILICHLYDARHAVVLLWLPLAAGVGDILENLLYAWLAWQFPDWLPLLGPVARMLTGVKFGGFFGALFAIAVGALWWFLRTRPGGDR